MNKETREKNKYLKYKVDLVGTMRTLPIGKPILFSCKEAGCFSSAQSAASRLSRGEGTTFNLSTDDNGATYTITRLS